MNNRWPLGFVLAFVTALSWGFQSVAMSVIVRDLPALTVAFSKMFFSAVAMGLFHVVTKRFQILGAIKSVPKRGITLAMIASMSLAFSYGLFASAFNYVSPANVQLYMQSERFLLALCGIFIFKEAFQKLQWVGLWIIPVGYYLFFRDQISHTESATRYTIGVSLVISTAVTWVVYALCQKQLLKYLTSQGGLLLIFSFSSVLLFPFADLQALLSISLRDGVVLGLICCSSVLAFGCFAEALRHWDISRIGAVISTTPLVTLLLTVIGALVLPSIVLPEQIDTMGMVGAVLIVVGSAMGSLSNR